MSSLLPALQLTHLGTGHGAKHWFSREGPVIIQPIIFQHPRPVLSLGTELPRIERGHSTLALDPTLQDTFSLPFLRHMSRAVARTSCNACMQGGLWNENDEAGPALFALGVLGYGFWPFWKEKSCRTASSPVFSVMLSSCPENGCQLSL